MIKMTMFSKPRCVQCNASKMHMKKVDQQHEVIDMTEHVSALEEARALGYQQAPVFKVEVDGVVADHWSGFNPGKLDKWHALQTQGASEALTNA